MLLAVIMFCHEEFSFSFIKFWRIRAENSQMWYLSLTNHGWTTDERQQSVDQSLKLQYERLWWVGEDGLQAGQRGQLDALIRTWQSLQKKRQELDRDKKLCINTDHFPSLPSSSKRRQSLVAVLSDLRENELAVKAAVCSSLTAGSSVTWTCLGSLLTMLDSALR